MILNEDSNDDEDEREENYLSVGKKIKIELADMDLNKWATSLSEDLEIIDKETLKSLEPNISNEALGALYAKTGGIVCPYELTIAAVGNAMDNGVQMMRNS